MLRQNSKYNIYHEPRFYKTCGICGILIIIDNISTQIFYKFIILTLI